MDICEDSNDSSITDNCKECVICGQYMESTEERPIGLIVFMHSSTSKISIFTSPKTKKFPTDLIFISKINSFFSALKM